MMNMTVYEDSDPANLAIEAGKNLCFWVRGLVPAAWYPLPPTVVQIVE